MRPLPKPARKSSYASALANHRHDHACGGNARIALSLKAASVTTNAGCKKKPKMTKTTRMAAARWARWRQPDISVGSKLFEGPGSDAHETEHGESERQARDRQA